MAELSIKDKLIALYNQYTQNIADGLPNVVNCHRQAAIKQFAEQGIPFAEGARAVASNGDERYRYIDLKKAFGYTYGYLFAQLPKSGADNFKCAVQSLDAYTVSTENGWLTTACDNLPKGLHILPFADAAQQFPNLFEKYYNKQVAQANDSLLNLNTAFARSGVFVYVEPNTLVDKPIQIINQLNGENPLMVHQRNLIVVGEGSAVKVVVCDHSASTQRYLHNNVTEVEVEDNANVGYYNIQNMGLTTAQLSQTLVGQHASSSVTMNQLTLHGRFMFNRLDCNLLGQHAEVSINALGLADGTQSLATSSFVNHTVPNCTSNELVKNIVEGSATCVFNGHVLVQPDAQKTQAYQSNKNICSTPTAHVQTKPRLEIYADDVKCSHGATVGQLDESVMFYMRQRGIGVDEARMMLKFAFAHEIISKIDVPVLAERYSEMVEERLRSNSSGCVTCEHKCL
ncbi:MAG: Fe-S cluster assembly protein SufD [Salinivirgaceae bacterium]|nr:Fe-S cluster assembly protein SufD [Salinivirgaceae bacterium]